MSFRTQRSEVRNLLCPGQGTGDDEVEVYLFRFRTVPPHWSADDGWMAGVAGPYLKRETPSPEAHGGTFSQFTPWDSKTPEEHVHDIQELLIEWGTAHGDK